MATRFFGPDDQSELFLAIIGATGTDMRMLFNKARQALARFDYRTVEVHLSDHLRKLDWGQYDPGPPVDDKTPRDERLWRLMSQGTRLRQIWGRGDALALLGVSQVDAERAERAERTGWSKKSKELPPTLPRHAFVFNSLKHPDEVTTLRSIYGARLFVIAAYSPQESRRKRLAEDTADDRGTTDESTWGFSPETLMLRDESEPELQAQMAMTGADAHTNDTATTAGDLKLGQRLRDTFYLADAFVAAEPATLAKEIGRLFDVFFGDPFRTPTNDEFGMFCAEGVARRSAELGRQVGAAIADANGSIIALGTNEVPAFGGGVYHEGIDPDGREFRNDRDTNRVRQEEIATEIENAIAVLLESGDPAAAMTFRQIGSTNVLKSILDTKLGDLTEFGRASHAEMTALLDAAARGVPVRRSTIYTTTFPCHNCARHVVAAGVSRLVYIAPYAKSQAAELHPDSIAVARATPPADKVSFEPFVGVAPRRYLELFEADFRERANEHLSRKDRDGNVSRFERKAAVPLYIDLEPEELRSHNAPYRPREARALNTIARAAKQTGVSIKRGHR